MAARIVSCGNCKANITLTGPGATFTCPKCQTVNSIPVAAPLVVAGQPVVPKKQQNPVAALITLGVLLFIGYSCYSSQHPSGGSGDVANSGTATEQALCAALDGDPNSLPPLIDAVSNDALSGVSLSLDGVSLELHLGMTNNATKVQEDINSMKKDCLQQAG